jgi:hypothetical protein
MFSRRDFIRNSSLTASLIAAGQLPLWAAGENGTYAVEGFDKVLKTYTPPRGKSGARKANYTLINMGKAYGKLSVSSNGSGTYACDCAIKPSSACKGKFVVNGDLLSGLKSWSTTSITDPVSKNMKDLCTYTEKGKVEDDRVVVWCAGKKHSKFRTSVPLIPDWLLPLAVPSLPKQGEYSFTLLREGTYFLGGQTLLCDGTVKFAVKGGQTLELTNYLHFGEGTLPTNYLVDENGVTVLVTHGLTAEVLS